MLNSPHKYPKWELKAMSIKQPTKVFWKLKVSKTDFSEQSHSEICEILFEIFLIYLLRSTFSFSSAVYNLLMDSFTWFLQGFWSQLSKRPFPKHDSKTANAHLCFDETKLWLWRYFVVVAVLHMAADKVAASF